MSKEAIKETKEKAEPGIKDGRQTPLYRALRRVSLTTTRQEYPAGTILDLSHLPQESIRELIRRGIYETADGASANDPAAPAQPCANCKKKRE